MNKFVLATCAAVLLGTAAFAQPAEARCWWNGYSWHCWHSHGWWGTIIHIGAIMDMAMALTGITTGTGIPDQCSGLEHRRAGGGSGDLAEHRA